MSRRGLHGPGVAAALTGALLLGAGTSDAHVVVQRQGLRQLLQSSELAVMVEFVSPLRMWEAPDHSDRCEYFSVRAIETLRGTAPPGRFDVFPHGEGMPDFQEGDVALLFLERSAERPEFAGLAKRFPYFTIQERGQEWKLEGRDGDVVRAAAQKYRKLLGERTGQGTASLRQLLLENLRSGVTPLRQDALAELVRVQAVPGFFPAAADLAPFTSLVQRDSGLPLTTRVAIARILDGSHGFDATAALRTLTQEPLSGEERLQLVRVVGAVPDPGLSAWLAAQLASPVPLERREAAYALAHPWHRGQLEALTRALGDPDPAVGRAALRAVGALESPEAAALLARIARGDDAFLRQLALAELRRASMPLASPPKTALEALAKP